MISFHTIILYWPRMYYPDYVLTFVGYWNGHKDGWVWSTTTAPSIVKDLIILGSFFRKHGGIIMSAERRFSNDTGMHNVLKSSLRFILCTKTKSYGRGWRRLRRKLNEYKTNELSSMKLVSVQFTKYLTRRSELLIIQCLNQKCLYTGRPSLYTFP